MTSVGVAAEVVASACSFSFWAHATCCGQCVYTKPELKVLISLFILADKERAKSQWRIMVFFCVSSSITQRLQPLDSVVSGLLKQRRGVYLSNKVWRQENLSWNIQGQTAINKESYPRYNNGNPLLSRCWTESSSIIGLTKKSSSSFLRPLSGLDDQNTEIEGSITWKIDPLLWLVIK